MNTYIRGYRNSQFEVRPCFHTVRQDRGVLANHSVVRMFRDAARLLCGIVRHRPVVVHALARYRSAILREVVFALIARLTLRKFFYEIKAGQFDTEFRRKGPAYRILVRAILAMSHGVGVEGKRYIEFLRTEFGIEPVYLPNICLDSEVPGSPGERFDGNELRILFVGFCYDGKGVSELVQGCCDAARLGNAIRLRLAGAESEDFAAWVATIEIPSGLVLERLGKVSHDQVLDSMQDSDLFCMPSRHPGEGHNNSVNEALMVGCCVAMTRHGFLGDILTDDCCYFIDDCAAEAVAKVIAAVVSDLELANATRLRGHRYFLKNYTSSIVFARLTQAYLDLLES